MTLGFSQEIKGVKNFFCRKIWTSLFLEFDELRRSDFATYNIAHKDKFGCFFQGECMINKPKLHTIRSGNRWRAGMDIHMVINNRTKNRFQFAPTIKCKSVQDIEIIHSLGHIEIFIDGDFGFEIWHHGLDDIYDETVGLLEFAQNDGFESVEAFFEYFNKDFTGQIIHWTDIKY